MNKKHQMTNAIKALQNIAAGDGTDMDLFEIMVAINESPSRFDGPVGMTEIQRATFATWTEHGLADVDGKAFALATRAYRAAKRQSHE